jgi:hypothetical protein
MSCANIFLQIRTSLPSSKYGVSSYLFTVRPVLAILSSSLPDTVPKYLRVSLYSSGRIVIENVSAASTNSFVYLCGRICDIEG